MVVGKETTVKLIGLSTDTKPTTGVPNNSQFFEEDTLNTWYFDGTYWSRKTGIWYPRGLSRNTNGVLGGFSETCAQYPASASNHTSQLVETVGDWAGIDRMDTLTTINTLVGIRWLTHITRKFNPWIKAKFKLGQTLNTRILIAFHSSTGGNPASSADPLNNVSGCGLFLDAVVSANWKLTHNDGGTPGLIDDTILVASESTLTHTVQIRGINSVPKFQLKFDTGNWIDITTDIPAEATALGILFYIENLDSNSRILDAYRLEEGVLA